MKNDKMNWSGMRGELLMLVMGLRTVLLRLMLLSVMVTTVMEVLLDRISLSGEGRELIISRLDSRNAFLISFLAYLCSMYNYIVYMYIKRIYMYVCT